MNTFQRVIKYVAIAFAIFLTIGILGGIVSVVSGVISIFGNGDEIKTIDYSKDFESVEKLKIIHKVGKLSIEQGNGFRVEASGVSDSFRAELVNGTLYIEEPDFIRRFLWFDFGIRQGKSVITVYVPKDFIAKRIEIESGAGNVSLQNLSTDYLKIDAGVGDVYGSNLTAKRVDANGGVGDMILTDVNFTDVDFDCGIGSIDIEGMILGRSEFDCGVGSVTIKINGAREEYTLKVDGGLGTVRVNGEKVSGEYKDKYKADNIISIDGGVGGVDITFTH